MIVALAEIGDAESVADVIDSAALTESGPIMAFIVSLTTCAALVLTRGWHIHAVIRRDDLRAVQAAHHAPTPRLGGLALLAVLLFGVFILPPAARSGAALVLVALTPVFASGLAEDLGYRVPPSGRLFAAACSAAIMILAFDVWLMRLDVPILDAWMAWTPAAMAVTIFCSTGVAHAFNLIDGVNGLAGVTGVVTALGLHLVAREAGLALHSELALIIAAAVAGFLVFNFPWGRIFLGDAGAYTLGHVLAWMGISLLFQVPDLSTWAVLLIFFWPVADTFLAIYRRSRSGRPAGQPDRLHFHQLVMRALEITRYGRKSRKLTNPLTTLMLLPMTVAPPLAGVAFWNDQAAAFAATVFFGVVFFATYALGVAYARKRGANGSAEVRRGSMVAPLAREQGE